MTRAHTPDRLPPQHTEESQTPYGYCRRSLRLLGVLLGTTMGGPHDWAAMLAAVERHQLRPIVSDVFPFTRACEAFDLMERGGQFGKIVLKP